MDNFFEKVDRLLPSMLRHSATSIRVHDGNEVKILKDRHIKPDKHVVIVIGETHAEVLFQMIKEAQYGTSSDQQSNQ